MAPKLSIIFFAILLYLVKGELSTSTSISQSSTPIPELFDASVGGEVGNPGAQLRFSTKALDTVYKHALKMIEQQLRAMNFPDVIVPVGGGMLTIRNSRVSEAKIPDYERHLLPPNKIKSRLYNGRLVSIGEWQYKPFNGARTIAQGIFRTVVVNAEMNITNQFQRTWDAKPMIQTTECKAFLGQFRVEIEGFGDNTTVIDQCNNLLCQRIRSYFEDAVCNCARNYIKETINQKLSTFPTRINLGNNTGSNRFVLDYNLLNGEPKITEEFLQAYLEGEVLGRGVSSVAFHANDLSPITIDHERMISFLLGDYAFNTLFHQAHNQQFKFSANDLIPSGSAVKELLRLNCTNTPINVRGIKRKFTFGTGLNIGAGRDQICLGSIFENFTNQYTSDSSGDLVFKSQRPLVAIVRQPQKSYFGVTSGTIEAYGPIGKDGKRELIGRADIELLRGDFYPKMAASNITATVNITDLQLVQKSPAPIQARIRSMPDQVLSKLAQLSTPIFNEVFNQFLDEFAKFPVPLVEGYECENQEFHWGQRTMQIDCDVRVLADATKVGMKRG